MAKASTTKTNDLQAWLRTETGKGASRRARRNGRVPAVLYGGGDEPRHLELPAHEFAAVLRNAGTNAVLTLDLEGAEQLALTWALDIHPIRRTIQHADLLVVRRGEKVVVEVTVEILGDAAPGTLVYQELSTIEIEAEALSIPEHLTVSVEDVEAGTQFLAGEVRLPEGVTLVTDPEALVVNVVEAPTAEELGTEETEEAAEEGAAEPDAEPEAE